MLGVMQLFFSCKGLELGKHDKLRDKLKLRPPPSDVRWDELVALLESYGYKKLNGKGSRRKFHEPHSDALIICHEPHPSPVMDKGAIVAIDEHLGNRGL